jgi:probable rRNA maturation factor
MHRALVETVADIPDCSAPTGFPGASAIEGQAVRAIEAVCAIDRLDPPSGAGFSLTVLIVDDAAIAGLNRRYRQKAAPTDVLSFPLLNFPPGPGTSALSGDAAALDAILSAWPAPPGAELSDSELPGGAATQRVDLGDIVISYETCLRQAGEIGHSVSDEFQRLLVHGVLHLFGYDHETSAADQTLMREREDRLLAALDGEDPSR